MLTLRDGRADIPLVVDLDGALVKSDLFIESAFAFLGADPLRAPQLVRALLRGPITLKQLTADATNFDPGTLPYDQDVLALIAEAKSQGRSVYVASACPARLVQAVAHHLDLFDGWFSTDETTHLTGRAKVERIVAEFGAGGFDYVSDAFVDLPVWTAAHRRIAVHPNGRTRRALTSLDPEARIIESADGAARAWGKLLRIQQWAKNALVFVALVTAHRFDALSILQALGAFVAFSLAASAIYIINDLVDIAADRAHPTKKARPLAAGTVPLLHAIAASACLLVVALALSLSLPLMFSGTLLTYVALTTAYTFSLKRKMIVDVVALAGLYTIRVLAGAAAISVPVSEWLLGFSILIFTALALIKRYIELAARIDADLPDPQNRNYQKSDLAIVASLAAAASFNAVTLFAIYISSEAIAQLYRHPGVLWLICPILIYWLSRALIMAQRRFIDDDPVAFALRDRNSLIAAALIAVLLFAAI